MKVFKFGGTSLTSLDSFKFMLAALDETQSAGDHYVVVVSAVAGITNRLEAVANRLASGKGGFEQEYQEIVQIHQTLLAALFGPEGSKAYWEQIKGDFERLNDHFKQCLQKGKCKKKDRDYILGFGELISAGIVTRFLNLHDHAITFLDARKIILTRRVPWSSSVDFDQTISNIAQHFKSHPGNKVVPGYIAADKLGQMTTIGRGGSDYTAALLGVGLKARAVVKFTDVKGILTADPKIVPQAASIKNISASELLNVIKFSAGVVVYPGAVTPLMQHNIPLLIKCTYDQAFPGTEITPEHLDNPSCIVAFREGSVIVRSKRKLPSPLLKYAIPHGKFCVRSTGSGDYPHLLMLPDIDWKPLESFLIKAETSRSFQHMVSKYEVQNVSVLTLTGEGLDHRQTREDIEQLLEKEQVDVIAMEQHECSIVVAVAASQGRKAAAILHGFYHVPSDTETPGVEDLHRQLIEI